MCGSEKILRVEKDSYSYWIIYFKVFFRYFGIEVVEYDNYIFNLFGISEYFFFC